MILLVERALNHSVATSVTIPIEHLFLVSAELIKRNIWYSEQHFTDEKRILYIRHEDLFKVKQVLACYHFGDSNIV